MNRFSRQVILQGFGLEGQRKLQASSVLVVGAGGLGCPALLYLAAVGVGRIGIVDGDQVDLSNLNRQVLYGEQDLGKNKAEVAAAYFQKKYRDIKWEIFPEVLETGNAKELISGYDLILDGSDNFPTRYLVNDACVLLGKPLVFGAIYQHEGQVSVFNWGKNSANYRDLYPEMPAASEIPNCSETGVLGVLPGIIGNLMALEAIKVLTGYGKPLANKVLFFNSLNSQSYEVELSPRPESSLQSPQTWEALESLDYALACEGVKQVSWEEVMGKMNSNIAFVDVRELDEKPELNCTGLWKIPMSVLSEKQDFLAHSEEILLFCQSGVRSLKAAQTLISVFPDKKISSIKGGMNALKKS
ncbi:adenylyltransferase/sulfurtransferase [Algoriphagus boseongensis]|uniref:Molybdopterin-synthase adenylyltransferase n=1 Tax=Algoriphagus boseongensis TaxID=1442587 RepID=A0A4R6T9I4_9BACT|nr:HesA/MoeB/ThiF family protein [Algoriphagus boseongensis]TDQ19436.1 adenylyltransferase/sulfurtransferase [Algoriphagus boseongensis]